MTWQIATMANLVTGCAYLAIAWLIASGLVATGQLRTNRLGAATALIFVSAGVNHGAIGVDLLLPSFGAGERHGVALRDAWDWQLAAWDVVCAVVCLWYLSLRGSYASVLRTAQMFEDRRVRERQALEINDNIVQGLTVAKYALTMGADDQSRQAIEDTLRRARSIITGLIGEPGSATAPGPGDLRREGPALAAEPPPPGGP